MTSTTIGKQFFASLLLLVCTIALFELTNIDIALQDHLYVFAMHHWLIDRNEPVLKFLLYDGIKGLYIAIFLLLLAGRIFYRKLSWLQGYKQGLTVACISIVLVPLVVAGLKEMTNMPCPRDLQHYESIYPHTSLFASYPKSFHPPGDIACYPAAHASGGFAFMSLFFLFRNPRNRRLALATAVSVGWATGIYKMMIGDHFLGHTVVSMLLAWSIILLVYARVYGYSWREQADELKAATQTA